MFNKTKLTSILSEFLGAFILASAVLAIAGRTGFPFYGGIATGLTLAVLIVAFTGFRVHINPIITIGFWSARKLPTIDAIMYVAAQMIGGVTALFLNSYIASQTIPRIATYGVDWKILLAEAIGAFVLLFIVAAVVHNKMVGLASAAMVGLAYTVGIFVASIGSNGIINPSVAVGLNSWSWAYAAGPVIGAVVGINFYDIVYGNAPKAKSKKRRVNRKKKR